MAPTIATVEITRKPCRLAMLVVGQTKLGKKLQTLRGLGLGY
jgi:hypothetical protein